MHPMRPLLTILFAACMGGFFARPADAAGPRNPYSGFNLSGINYGAQQWERAQRQGRAVWPYYNTPSRGYSRGSGTAVGGVVAGGGGAGTIIQAGSSRPAQRPSAARTTRRWRR